MLLLVLEFSQVSTFTLVVMLAWETLVHGIFHQVSVCSQTVLLQNIVTLQCARKVDTWTL